MKEQKNAHDLHPFKIDFIKARGEMKRVRKISEGKLPRMFFQEKIRYLYLELEEPVLMSNKDIQSRVSVYDESGFIRGSMFFSGTDMSKKEIRKAGKEIMSKKESYGEKKILTEEFFI